MIILLRIDDLMPEYYPELNQPENNYEALRQKLIEEYSFQGRKPGVEIKDGVISIEINTEGMEDQQKYYEEVVSLCEKGQYEEAKPLLDWLLFNNPTVSEYHRIYGQILSDEGEGEDAIDCFIEALKWDPKNTNALLMMGNVILKYRNDPETAMKYYDRALSLSPMDHYALHGIGNSFLRQNNYAAAKKYFEKVLAIQPDYPNTYFGLALAYEAENDLYPAFHHAIEAVKNSPAKDQLQLGAANLAMSIAQKIIAQFDENKTIKDYIEKLVKAGGVDIVQVLDENIVSAAKFEFSWNHSRDHHVIKYQPGYPANLHLRMHELVHLDFVLQARGNKTNEIFITNQAQKESFIKLLEPAAKKLRQQEIPENAINKYLSGLFEGINLQAYNTPIDLFIEQFLYDAYPELRPFQFLSLHTLLRQAQEAVTRKDIVDIVPAFIVSKSKIYNLVNGFQFKALYGLDFTVDFKPTKAEIDQAQEFYTEYLTYKNDRAPGEEYEMIYHWAQDLKLDDYFDLVTEEEYQSRQSDFSDIISKIEYDPFGMEEDDPSKTRATKNFIESQAEMGTNMAVVFFMVDALQYFKKLPEAKIKEIAVEIALQGTQGYFPEKKGYKLHHVPGKDFSGYHILAWYYVSWKLAMPEMVDKLNLPYDQEYNMAIKLFENNKYE